MAHAHLFNSRRRDIWAWATVLNAVAVRWDPGITSLFGLTDAQLDALVPTAGSVLTRYADEPRVRDDDFREGEHLARGLRAQVDQAVYHALEAVATMLPSGDEENTTTGEWVTVLNAYLDYTSSTVPASGAPRDIDRRLAKCRAALEARQHPRVGRRFTFRDDEGFFTSGYPEGTIWFSPHGCLASILIASVAHIVMPILVGGLSDAGRRALLNWADNRAKEIYHMGSLSDADRRALFNWVDNRFDAGQLPPKLVILPKWEIADGLILGRR